MDLIVSADCHENAQPLLRVASKAGYRILKLLGPSDDASRYVESLRPDAVIFYSDELTGQVAQDIEGITAKRPTPIVVFTRDSRSDSIDSAVKAGATTYVVDCNVPERLGSLLEVARSRFREQQRIS